ncbi:MAG: hypothetical protein K2X38_14375 [Gemmataceae bacterium]|nr:hypothetical protein [Gemmataceae bacterium]
MLCRPRLLDKSTPTGARTRRSIGLSATSSFVNIKIQRIAFAAGAVIAACKTSLKMLHTPSVVAQHPFVICVGREDEPYRIRRSPFAYDLTYPGQALPLLGAEFRSVSGSAGLVLDRINPDTGADVSVLPWPDCQPLQLDPAR